VRFLISKYITNAFADPRTTLGSLQRSPGPDALAACQGAASRQRKEGRKERRGEGREGKEGKGRGGSVPRLLFYNLTTGRNPMKVEQWKGKQELRIPIMWLFHTPSAGRLADTAHAHCQLPTYGYLAHDQARGTQFQDMEKNLYKI